MNDQEQMMIKTVCLSPSFKAIENTESGSVYRCKRLWRVVRSRLSFPEAWDLCSEGHLVYSCQVYVFGKCGPNESIYIADGEGREHR